MSWWAVNVVPSHTTPSACLRRHHPALSCAQTVTTADRASMGTWSGSSLAATGIDEYVYSVWQAGQCRPVDFGGHNVGPAAIPTLT